MSQGLYTNRQIILVRVEEVVQVIDGHHQVCLMDQACGSHAVVSSCPLSICTNILTVNSKISGSTCPQIDFGCLRTQRKKAKLLLRAMIVYANWFMLPG